MKILDWNRAGEILSLIGSLCGLLAILGLVGCGIELISHLPHVAHCCDDAGEPYYAPSAIIQFLAVILFPFIALIGLVLGVFLGFWQVSVATFVLICLWAFLKAMADGIEERWRSKVIENMRNSNDKAGSPDS